MPVEPGSTGAATLTVSQADTAMAIGSGDIPALATARVVALCEEAGFAATDGHLADGTTTVGASIQLTHIAPCAIGSNVRAEAKLDRVEGRRLHFSVSVKSGRGLVAAGKLTRALVDRDDFLGRIGE